MCLPAGRARSGCRRRSWGAGTRPACPGCRSAASRRSAAARPRAPRRAPPRRRPPGRRRDAGQGRARRGTCPPACPPTAGSSSSTWLSPTSSSTASTPCSAIVSRCTSGMPYARVWSSIADSRSATATPMWSMRPNTAASVPSAVRAARPRGQPRLRERARTSVSMPGAEVFGLGRARARSTACDRIVVAGGDGTIGPVAELAGRLDVPLAVIPTGTANDFARANGIPLDVEAAARLAASRHGAARRWSSAGWRRAPVRQRRQRRACRASPAAARSR